MPLPAQAERLQALEDEERGEWVQRGPDIAQELRAHAHREGRSAERLAELEPMVALRGLGEPGELAGFRPVKFACAKKGKTEGKRWFNEGWMERSDEEDEPESMITPAMVVPWPPIHLVALWTVHRA